MATDGPDSVGYSRRRDDPVELCNNAGLVDSWESQNRALLLRRTGATCAFCGAPIHTRFGSGWTVARWIAETGQREDSRANTDMPGNLWPACAHCADEKGDLDGYQYVQRRLERGSAVHPRWEAYARIAAAVVDSVSDDVAAVACSS